jgi:hypothetical protein
MSNTTDILKECIDALEFRSWISYQCIKIRSISESDFQTLDRAITTVVKLAYICNEINLKSNRYNNPPEHTLTAYELISIIINHPEEAKKYFDKVYKV